MRINYKNNGGWRLFDDDWKPLGAVPEVVIQSPCRLVGDGNRGWLEVQGHLEIQPDKAVIREPA